MAFVIADGQMRTLHDKVVSHSKSGTGGNRHGFDESGVLSKATTLDLFSARLALSASVKYKCKWEQVGGWGRKKVREKKKTE